MIAIMGVALLAALIQGTVGFGYVLVAAPLLSVFLVPQVAVPVMILLSIFTSIPILIDAWRHVRLGRVWLMAVAGAVGVLPGTLIILVVNPAPLKVAIGLLVCVTAVAMIFGFQRSFKSERAVSVPVGFAGGVLGASTGLAGPPVILFYANQSLNRHEFRANIVVYYTVIAFTILPGYIIGDLYPRDTLILSLQLIPVTIIGVVVGIVLNRYVNDILFRRAALLLIVLSGVVAVVSGLGELL